jgi:hypothetical protein
VAPSLLIPALHFSLGCVPVSLAPPPSQLSLLHSVDLAPSIAARTSGRRVWNFKPGDRTPQTNPAHPSRQRPRRTECSESPVTSEAKRRKVRFALGWGTAWEVLRVLSSFTCFLWSALPWGTVLPACRPACVPWLCPCLPGTPAALAIFDSFFPSRPITHLDVASGTTNRATGLPTKILDTLLAD